jgi:hypothetical protein
VYAGGGSVIVASSTNGSAVEEVGAWVVLVPAWLVVVVAMVGAETDGLHTVSNTETAEVLESAAKALGLSE